MKKLICANVFAPLRIGPSHKSEQGSQILFGEKYTILDRSAKWIKVSNEFDGYAGWLDGDHHLYFATEEHDFPTDILAARTEFTDDNGHVLVLEAGSEIYNINKEKISFTIGKAKFTARSKVTLCPVNEPVSETALRFLNCPYLWGGRISGGMDCSGLTQLVYKLHGYSLPRDSFMQAEVGETISFIEEGKAGDLLFFDDDRGNITHVGLLLNRGYVIHCSGKVRIDRIDHQGIYAEETNRYTHRLRTIKRVNINYER
ncbi:MAG: C40 family peptidase [Bacteroidota bacterium]|nr:C40 family peptidase [Bacteroidota bacterium]